MEHELRTKLALACRILFMEGQGSYHLGHVTARLPNSELLLMKPAAMGLEEVTADDMVVLDLDGNKVGGKRKPHNEIPIHTSIMRMRPEINSVIHTHPPYAVAFSSLGQDLPIICHQALAFTEGIALLGHHSDLIKDRAQGDEMAKIMGNKNTLLLQNHGIVVAGTSIEDAVIRALALENSIKIYWLASSMGTPIAVPERSRVLHSAARSIQERWDYLVRKVTRELG